jgi:hypothetical protein
LLLVPSPLVGEGVLVFQRRRRGEGALRARPPHPSSQLA